jgi:cell division protein FtsW
MTAAVTSIARARQSARKRADATMANHRVSLFIIAIVGLLVVIGLGATLSASSVKALDTDLERIYFFKRQAMWVAIGIVVMVAAAKTPYQWYAKFAPWIYLVSVTGLVAVLFVGNEAGGATRWIEIGPVGFQPSELSKFGLPVMLASILTKKRKLLGEFGHFFVPVALTIGLTSTLLILEPDFGTALVIVVAGMSVIVASVTPLRFVGITVLAGVAGAMLLAVSQPYRLARITSFLSADPDVLGTGWQLNQSLNALGTGGLFGIGLGQSRARWLYLPNAHTDFIFAIIGEEMGFAGAVFVLMLLALLTLLGAVTALRARDSFGRLLAVGITAWVCAQALVNVGGVVGALPISGIALPFVSYGGTAIVMAMASAGVLINIAMQGRAGGMPTTR